MKDEFSLIRSITPEKAYHKELIQGIGDDSAIYTPIQNEHQIVCMDTMVEGVHFTEQTMSPFQIGWKALAVNLSDIAAMGGTPDYYLVSIAFPSVWYDRINEIYRGLSDLAKRFNIDLIGGDTVSSDKLTITVTAIGHTFKRKYFLRSQAWPGDVILVTGTLGDSAAGLRILLGELRGNDDEMERTLIKNHQLPFPLIEAGQIMAQMPYHTSLNDISDGLASEANEIAEASGVKLIIDYSSLPKSDELLQLDPKLQKEYSLFGGEDYQLLITAPESAVLEYQQAFKKVGIRLTRIGYVEEGSPSVYLVDGQDKALLSKKGFNHFTD
ncbi:thiamine-phosphate kinase [Terrilactibacillus laevilacticus]|uniref:Thiamine-monophosphate kinase n=1 Tax=Terrilactibacillus laevilacticus TaxID=1380157 RepID=A0ABW5PS91_9BACI|nr:thiamine-phosphate kinase [Terrilactibacillus laevilacticus]